MDEDSRVDSLGGDVIYVTGADSSLESLEEELPPTKCLDSRHASTCPDSVDEEPPAAADLNLSACLESLEEHLAYLKPKQTHIKPRKAKK